MPTFHVTAPNGKTYEVMGPDGSTAEQALAQVQAHVGTPAGQTATAAAQADEPFPAKLGRQVLNAGAGAIRGAGSIGATILYPVDKITDMLKGDRGPTLSGMVTGQQPQSRNEERRQAMTDALAGLGADTNGLAFGAGKLAGEVAGTAGVGGVAANALGRVPGVAAAIPDVLAAIRSGGFASGGASGVPGAAVRAAGGAVSGGLSAGMVDPSEAGKGALIGGALPGGVQLAGVVGNALRGAVESGSRRLMQSAIKPTIQQLRTGDADTAVNALLDYGISPTKAGVEKLRGLIDDLNGKVSNEIAGSSATVSKQNVLNALTDVRQRFGNQVSPTSDLNAIQGVADDFLAHPNLPGNDIPVQAAQSMKQGTYSVLKGKYGQLGSAETEAQKGLARGLKDEIAAAVPGVGPLNAEESRLLTTLSVAERRALMEMNKNPGGLALLAHSPLGWAAFMADKSAAFKALTARMVNAAAPVASSVGSGLLGAGQSPLLRNSAVIAGAANP